MNKAMFDRMLDEIYSNFGRRVPTMGSTQYANLYRRLCEGKDAIPDEAAQAIAYRFEQYDTLPTNVGKAIRNEYAKWRAEHPEKTIRRPMCPNCDPKAGAGYVFVHDAKGKNYIARCTCNWDDPDSQMSVATEDHLKRFGLALGYIIDPGTLAAAYVGNEVTQEDKRAMEARLNAADWSARPEHLAQLEYAGVTADDCPF